MRDLQTGPLEQGLDHIAASPADRGTVEMIVRRPSVDERETICSAQVEPGHGLVGDSWGSRPHPSPHAELTLMNSRCIALLANDVDRWPLAGDQLYVDLDLSVVNLPAGSRLRVGSALIEVSAKPHSGCSKFSSRFGAEALAFVNSDTGRAMRLRGLNAWVVEGGPIRTGDRLTKE